MSLAAPGEVVETIEDVDLGDGEVADDNVPQTSGASEPQDMCRICHGGAEDSSNKLISPCLCLGSLKYVHFSCLERWTRTADKRACELCRFRYNMTVKTKPLCKWELMNLSPRQKVKIVVAVTCHLVVLGVTLTALFWLLGGLRHADGPSSASSHRWSFWKLVVLVVCIVTWLFMSCLNGKTCFIFFKRWRSLNSVMHFQNVPESADFRVKAVAKIRAERKRGTTAGIARDVVLQEVVSSQD